MGAPTLETAAGLLAPLAAVPVALAEDIDGSTHAALRAECVGAQPPLRSASTTSPAVETVGESPCGSLLAGGWGRAEPPVPASEDGLCEGTAVVGAPTLETAAGLLVPLAAVPVALAEDVDDSTQAALHDGRVRSKTKLRSVKSRGVALQ